MTESPDFMLVRPKLSAPRPTRSDTAVPPDPWPSDDPVGEALQHVQISGAFYCHSELTEPWGLTLPPLPEHLWFHAPIRGRCWLETKGDTPHPVEAGGLALVPHGQGHRLRSAPGVPAPEILRLERERVSGRYERLRHGGGGESTLLICGAVRLGGAAAPNLRRVLPRVLVAASAEVSGPGGLRTLLDLLASEAEARRPGSEAVVTRLADALVILAIRAWIDDATDGRTGWLSALRDPQVGLALTLMHRHPEHGWTVDTLARRTAMSRSAFADRFRALAGEPPMGYLARWRMQLACTALRTEGLSVGRVAARLGYQSEAAFSRAFKRIMGVAPGAVRRGGADDEREPW